MGKVRTRKPRNEDWLQYVDEFRERSGLRFCGTKNFYLSSILQNIKHNLRLIDKLHPEVDEVAMLKTVIRRCNSIISTLQAGISTLQTDPSHNEYVDTYIKEIRPELGPKSRIKKVKS